MLIVVALEARKESGHHDAELSLFFSREVVPIAQARIPDVGRLGVPAELLSPCR